MLLRTDVLPPDMERNRGDRQQCENKVNERVFKALLDQFIRHPMGSVINIYTLPPKPPAPIQLPIQTTISKTHPPSPDRYPSYTTPFPPSAPPPQPNPTKPPPPPPKFLLVNITLPLHSLPFLLSSTHTSSPSSPPQTSPHPTLLICPTHALGPSPKGM